MDTEATESVSRDPHDKRSETLPSSVTGRLQSKGSLRRHATPRSTVSCPPPGDKLDEANTQYRPTIRQRETVQKRDKNQLLKLYKEAGNNECVITAQYLVLLRMS